MSMINKEISDFRTYAYHENDFKFVSKEDILGNAVGGVCQHRIVDFLDALGGIVPSLVDKVGIGGHGVNLTADGLKLLVLVRQILQLRRTNEGKVRRIEEKDAPFSKDIFLAYKLKLVFVIGIGAKIGNFLVDHRHTYFLHKSC